MKYPLTSRGESIQVTGQINFSNIVKYPKSIFSPGIMGWYSFIPFMECNHGIVSVNHDLRGRISVNRNVIDFDGGKGYIEKDWGVSFPEAWIWIQSNNFEEHDTSFSFSIAKIPWMGRYFIGFISFLYLNKKFYLFSTYNKSTVSEITRNKDIIEISVRKQRKHSENKGYSELVRRTQSSCIRGDVQKNKRKHRFRSSSAIIQ